MRPKVLIADDDAAIVDAIHMILDLEGYEVETIDHGNVVTAVHIKKPDLVLLDIWMSGQDGREICMKLKADKDTAEIPVILVSASRDVEGSAQKAKADDFITKPFDMDDLLSKVRHFTSDLKTASHQV